VRLFYDKNLNNTSEKQYFAEKRKRHGLMKKLCNEIRKKIFLHMFFKFAVNET